ncbi:peptidase domain-containing ABC transporter [Dyella terrae]|uniref:peptidase domain-containing ABC transporter n=1 Tax=Dyella terrae TaxID=522259 RepID=UPI001EFE052C|nr:peptidase domain-containing ABC transporter [Dyella terrae]ULU25286.1 peptidase domain-containing ABC transporter [Dyella terrae]
MADGSDLPVWGRGRELPLVMQAEAAECGLACIAMIASYHGHDTDLAALRRRFHTSLKGTDVTRLMGIANALGFEARPLRAELNYLPEAQFPCILHWDMAHFVVLHRISRRGAEIYDPARGRYWIPLAEVSKHFTGIVLELIPGANFKPMKERERVSLRMLTGKIVGLRRAVIQVVGLALAIEAMSLVFPFQMQWVVDQVLLSSDTSLLFVLTVGFLIVMTFQAALVVARGWILSWLGASLNAQWTTNLFSHLLKLPMDYFEKRHMGDIVSRFSSLQAIQNTLTGGFVEAVLDGVMGFLALVILCQYSMPLTACVLVASLAYSALRWLLYRTLWRINEEQLVYTAKQQSELMESVRGVRSIKLANKQNERKARLSNATVEAAKRGMYSQRITLTFGALNQSLFGIQRILLISLGAYLVMKNRFSAGMLIAFVAYADQFATKVGGLIDKIVDLRMLRLHAERIADMALHAPEANVAGSNIGAEPEPSIEVSGLGFRYADGEPWVLKDFNLTIGAGETVAIVGPSGCGKSTLAKLILGLLEPSEGVIRVGGLDIRNLGLENYRNMVSAVMQDDNLFAGSVADNISFFDTHADLQDIISAAKSAAIHADIEAMPMRYESLVGDMGSSLSGGQKQRLILARAIYRRPRILLLDEATSHLDVEKETMVNAMVKDLRMTKIVIAHRPETIRMADRVVRIDLPSVSR